MTVIPLPPVTPYSAYPMGINNSGQVVGYVQHADSSESPFIATASGFTFIPLPPGVTQVVPTNINDSGQVTTLFSEYFGLSAPAIGTVGGFVPIPLLPASTCSQHWPYPCTIGWTGVGWANRIFHAPGNLFFGHARLDAPGANQTGDRLVAGAHMFQIGRAHV